ncbi:DNA replication/repair protein RecF [Heliophilum fasciatum]|uniref:DNA replication and repair protein RecF n=1 Tax=Heliophilum fasciatum TaxID=35700 RepID=A0A4R2RLX7_9FIRM|nr:DNA replication/repair protein RecF [Heliophilum fasciatum]MCW2278285.1 DNA replication and repair protein RecF [Heliophilum fasciatum]TCP63908.1 DNA replication and repair protein RecF [Heliophilum fasciatum]
MKIQRLELTQFRNYAEMAVDLQPGVNIFVGPNGQGKTNLLEAVTLLSGAGSHRDAKDAEMVKWQAAFYRIVAQGRPAAGNGAATSPDLPATTVELAFGQQRKWARVNGRKLKRMNELAQTVNTVVFSPEDLSLVKGSPGQRRRFLDRELSQASPAYHQVLVHYQRMLSQRNALLKQIRNQLAKVHDIELWDEQMARCGATLLARRLDGVARLAPKARQIYRSLSAGKEELEITYGSSLPLPADRAAWPTAILRHWAMSREEEILRQTTLTGPHRDDLNLYLNGRDARSYASQGQQRSIALALKLSEVQLIASIRQEPPIVLLDDVMSELDPLRREQLLTELNQQPIQVIITTTHLQALPEALIRQSAIFRVYEGKIQRDPEGG